MHTPADDAYPADRPIPRFPQHPDSDYGGGVVVYTGASWDAIRAYVADVTDRPLADCDVAAHEVLGLAVGTLAAHYGIDAHYDGLGIDDRAGTLWVAPDRDPDAVVDALFLSLGQAAARLVDATLFEGVTWHHHTVRLAHYCHEWLGSEH